jgi:hypothetical protein
VTDMGAVRPTRKLVLVAVAVLSTGLSWLVVSWVYSSLPAAPLIALLTPLFLALVLGYLAWTTRLRVRRSPKAAQWRPLDPLVIARFLALAKASAVAGALGVGFWAGYLLVVLDDLSVAVARRDAVASGVGIVLSVAVVVAALALENACRVPPSDDEGQNRGSGSQAPT